MVDKIQSVQGSLTKHWPGERCFFNISTFQHITDKSSELTTNDDILYTYIIYTGRVSVLLFSIADAGSEGGGRGGEHQQDDV